MTYYLVMHTVIETPAYLNAADDAGMTADERDAVIKLLAETPDAGDLMSGTGGCRKVRIAGRGKGKSGGYRVITYYVHGGVPVFLLTVFSKGERANLTKAQRNALQDMSKKLVAGLGPRAISKNGE